MKKKEKQRGKLQGNGPRIRTITLFIPTFKTTFVHATECSKPRIEKQLPCNKRFPTCLWRCIGSTARGNTLGCAVGVRKTKDGRAAGVRALRAYELMS